MEDNPQMGRMKVFRRGLQRTFRFDRIRRHLPNEVRPVLLIAFGFVVR
jgi:hypothetical protein